MQDPYSDAPEATNVPMALNGKTQVLGLDYKTAGILCYLPICAINLIASLVFLNSEPRDNKFLRFHSMQSLVMCAVYIAAAIANTVLCLILAVIPIIGPVIAFVINLAFLGLTGLFIWKSVVGMIAASKGEMKKIEYIGDIAEQRLGG